MEKQILVMSFTMKGQTGRNGSRIREYRTTATEYGDDY